MPLINTSVPNLIQGVSQQADATRFAGQCEEQENALSAVADGLKKRPNTRHIARLIGSAISTNSFVHFINRSADEKYVIILDGTTLRAFNIQTGAQCTINGNSSYTTTSGYLNSSVSGFNPRKHIKALTVADNTFLLNTQKAVLQNSTNKSDPVTDSALVTIKQGDYYKKYQITALRKIAPATVGVSITPSGIKYRHNFSITSPRYAYHFDTTNTGTLDYEQVFRIYPKGFTPNHPAALRAEIGITQADYNALTSTQQSFINSRQIVNYTSHVINITKLTKTNGVYDLLDGANQPNTEGYVELDEEFSEWVVEAPRVSSNMGSFDIQSGSAANSASFNASTAGIASQLLKSPTDTGYNSPNVTTPDGVTYNDFSVPEARAAFTSNFSFKQQGSSIIIFNFPKQGETFDTFWGDAGNITTASFTMGDGDTVEFLVEDGLAGNGMSVAHKQTDSISSLPAKCLNNFKIKVIGDAQANEDDYYVKFVTNSGTTFGDGAFVETSGSNINQQIDSTTFLHRLINTASNAFSLKSVDPTARTAGDDISNPFPSFVYDGVNGNQSDFTISNLFFFKNRLGLLSNENVIMSEAGEPFNFFRKTTLSLLDSAPIDVAVASNKVTNLKNATGFQENLILFSESGQFVLKSSGLLTPETVSISPITNFNFEAEVAPLALGSYIYFPFNRGSFTGLREFVVNSSTDTYEAIEVTEHVPAYVPDNIVDMAGTTTEDIIVLLSNKSGEQKTLYVYAYFWNNNQKILSSWSKFTFADDIRGIEFIGSTLYMVTVDAFSNTHLVTLPFQSGLKDINHNNISTPFNTLVDMRVRARVNFGSNLVEFEQPDGSYSGANADLPYQFHSGAGFLSNHSLITHLGDEKTLKTLNVGSGIQVFLNTGTADAPFYGYVGLKYTMKYAFSTQVFKAPSGNTTSPTSVSQMKIRNGSLFFSKASEFFVNVTAKHRSIATNQFNASTYPDAEFPVGLTTTQKYAEGFYKFPIYSPAKHAKIELFNTSAFESNFTSAEFESFVHPRSKRYG